MLFDLFYYMSIFAALFSVSFSSFVSGVYDLWKPLAVFALAFLRCIVHFAVFLLIVSFFVHTERELEKPNRFFQRLTSETSSLIMRLTKTKLHICGEEKLPKSENFLLVCNHRHYIDPLVILAQLKDRSIGFVAKKEIERIPIVSKLLYMCGGVFLNRENNREAVKPMRKATQELSEGLCDIGIFPEGTRNTEETLLPLHSGAFSIAKRSGKPIVVATLTGTENILGKFRLGCTDVHLNICKVISCEEQKEHSTAEISSIVRDTMLESLSKAM